MVSLSLAGAPVHAMQSAAATPGASPEGKASSPEPPPPFFERQAEEEGDQGPQSPGFNAIAQTGSWPWQASTLTGDWGGVRTGLGDRGVVITSTATLDLATVVSGGQRHGFLMPYLIDTNLSIDTGKFGLWADGQFFVDFQQAGCTQLASRYLPDFWGWDAIYPYEQSYTELSQYWLLQSFADGALKLKFGKIDANTDFAVSYPGLQFVNSAAFMPGNLVTDLPTYPNQAGGAEIMLQPVSWFGGKFGFFDGTTNFYNPASGGAAPPTGGHGMANFLWENPGSYFLIGEAGPQWTIDGLAGRAVAGWFDQTGDSTISQSGASGLNPIVTGSWGLYASGSQQLYQGTGSGQSEVVELFGQFGWSPPEQNPSQWSVMGGLTWQGLLPARPNDTFGALAGYTHFPDNPSITTSPGKGELVLESFYNVQVTPWLGLQPDVQYINQPSDVPGSGVSDAVILTLRVTINF